LVELANSEATVSLAWMPHNPQCLVTGTGVKWLRIYDIRGDINSPQSVVAHAKSVHGVSFDPFDTFRLITYSEDGLVKIWDLRNFSESVS
jgi:WD40 repeat protein